LPDFEELAGISGKKVTSVPQTYKFWFSQEAHGNLWALYYQRSKQHKKFTLFSSGLQSPWRKPGITRVLSLAYATGSVNFILP